MLYLGFCGLTSIEPGKFFRGLWFFVYWVYNGFLIFYLLDSESALVTDSLISRPLLTVLLLLYPLIDTLRAFLIRAYNNKSPFVADRVHLHHRLADKGYQHWQASVLTFSLSTFILVVNVLLFSTIGLLGGVALTVVLLTVFYYTFFK